MSYIPFQHVCKKKAEEETRVISIVRKDNEFGLPMGAYAFVELFCDECDCRRVFLQVFQNEKIVALIAYGWGSLAFYRKEFKGFSESEIKEIKGPTLDPFQCQSDISGGVFEMFNKVLFLDKAYLARIETHYNLFKKML
jgi:hypothetical protein